MKFIIYILGACGSGKSSLGALLNEKYGYEHLDIDDYFWVKTDLPFQTSRTREEVYELLVPDLQKAELCVLSGNLGKDAYRYNHLIDLAVFLDAPTDIRLTRLANRERKLFGGRIDAGGDMQQTHIDFIKWAAAYEGNDNRYNTRQKQQRQLEVLTCPIMHVDAKQNQIDICESVNDKVKQLLR